MVTAYTLTFGGLLLLGGRIADYWGRKRTFLVGMLGFALASALGGLAQNGEMLFAARALQGAFGALLAPAALALLTVLFTEAKERAKAFAVYGAIAGGGSAVGLLLGGVLTEYADWRWCLLVNIPVAVVAIALRAPAGAGEQGPRRHQLRRPRRRRGHRSAWPPWSTASPRPPRTAGTPPATLGFIAAGVVLLAAFVVIELRSATRCCRCGSSWTATAAARSSPRR